MQDNQKQIQEWQTKVRQSLGDESKLLHYLFETMDNFYYRYLETSENQNLKTQELGSHLWGASSFESNMGNAFKTSIKEAKVGITELAKRVPRDKKPCVRYSLTAKVQELTPEHGHLLIESEISWDFPNYKDPTLKIGKSISFKYEDLGQFRKELALKLEEACTLFI
jgi:hypothetical protein